MCASINVYISLYDVRMWMHSSLNGSMHGCMDVDLCICRWMHINRG